MIELLKPVYSYTIYRKREKEREIKREREREIEKEKKGQTSNDEQKVRFHKIRKLEKER